MSDKPTYEDLEEEIRRLRGKNESLLESLILWEFALEGADMGMWTHDLQTDLMTIDSNAERILGFKPDTNSNWDTYVHPEDIERVKLADFEMIHGRTQTYESIYRIVTKSGEMKWIQDRGKVVQFDKDGKPVRNAGIICDITEQKKTEDAFQETTKRLELSLNGAELGMWDWNIVEDSFSLDDRALEIIGFDPQILEDWYTHVHPDDLKQVFESDKALIEGHHDYLDNKWRYISSEETRWVHCQGKVVEWTRDGKPFRATGTFQDITKQKKTEKALLSEKHFIDMAIDSLPGMFYLFTNEGKFLRWNRKFETVSGYTPNEISTMSPREFFPVEEQALVEERIGEVFADGESFVEANWLSKDGTKTFYFLTGVRVEVGDTDNFTLAMNPVRLAWA